MNERGALSGWVSLQVYTAAAFVIVAAAVWALYPEGGFTVIVAAGVAASVSFAAIVAGWWAVLRVRDRRGS